MTIKFYNMPYNFKAGITLKNSNMQEQFNMALHICNNEKDVLNNRQMLADALDLPLQHFVFTNQTHSANFKKITLHDVGKGAHTVDSAIPNTDALYTFEKNIVLTTMTADCAPITFYSEVDGVIGTIHSGWAGTVKEIAFLLFKHLKNAEHIDLSNVYVHIGYSLCAEKFEVDYDVASQFEALGYANEHIQFNAETNKYHIDNQLVVKTQCERAGIPSTNITIDRECTYLSDECFSYRQNKDCGRHVSFIVQLEDKNQHVETAN